MDEYVEFEDEVIIVQDEGMLQGFMCALLALSPISIPILYKFVYDLCRSLL